MTWLAWAWLVAASLALLLVPRMVSSRRLRHIGTKWGDCSDEMFEAMREVDAMGLGGDPLLEGRIPPRTTEFEAQMRGVTAPEDFSVTVPGSWWLVMGSYDPMSHQIRLNYRFGGGVVDVEFLESLGQEKAIAIYRVREDSWWGSK